MIEVKADLWTYPADYRCVTTNGILKSNGELVMGAGCALEAKLKYPDLPARLGKCVKLFGNKPYFMQDIGLISFPTKHDWKDNSDMELIEASAREIAAFIQINHATVVIPRPGCGLGGLKWENVKPVLASIFDSDSFVICSN